MHEKKERTSAVAMGREKRGIMAVGRGETGCRRKKREGAKRGKRAVLRGGDRRTLCCATKCERH